MKSNRLDYFSLQKKNYFIIINNNYIVTHTSYVLLIISVFFTISLITASSSAPDSKKCPNKFSYSTGIPSDSLIESTIDIILAKGALTTCECVHAISLRLAFLFSIVV